MALYQLLIPGTGVNVIFLHLEKDGMLSRTLAVSVHQPCVYIKVFCLCSTLLTVGFDITDQHPVTFFFTFIIYWRKNGSTMRQYVI
jgi:hypothetical protein